MAEVEVEVAEVEVEVEVAPVLRQAVAEISLILDLDSTFHHNLGDQV